MTELIYDVCGGFEEGRRLKAVIPGGASVPIMSEAECVECTLDYEGVVKGGSMLGCASVIIMDDRTNLVKQVRRMVDFFAHESCGQCTPCREGTMWLSRILKRIEKGEGTEDDLDTLLDLGKQMTGTTICVLSDSAAVPVASSIAKFRDDYLALIRGGAVVGVG
jgi:NADH-quinone oxidoreductase subunit F